MEKLILCCYAVRDMHFSVFIALSGPLKFDHTVQCKTDMHSLNHIVYIVYYTHNTCTL